MCLRCCSSSYVVGLVNFQTSAGLLSVRPWQCGLFLSQMIITADERRVILTIDREIQEVTRDIETIVK